MQILLIEDDAMMGSTLTQGLSDLGLPPTELFHCKEIASLPALLRQHAFDAILCRQYHHQAHEGVRLLHEAHHLGLLAPGCVLLLLEQDEDTGQFPPSDLYFALRLAVPFTTEQLSHFTRGEGSISLHEHGLRSQAALLVICGDVNSHTMHGIGIGIRTQSLSANERQPDFCSVT